MRPGRIRSTSTVSQRSLSQDEDNRVDIEERFKHYQDVGLVFGMSFGLTAISSLGGGVRALWFVAAPLFSILAVVSLLTLLTYASERTLLKRVFLTLLNLVFVASGFAVSAYLLMRE